jgi:hypothetical protein
MKGREFIALVGGGRVVARGERVANGECPVIGI